MAGMLKVNQVANAAALAATTNYGFTADSHRVASVQAVWTATTASFALTLQCSNDNVTWADFTTATTVTDASGDVMWHVDSKDTLYWRVRAARTSGTLTTLKAYVAHVPR
jgi:hypothetical protein